MFRDKTLFSLKEFFIFVTFRDICRTKCCYNATLWKSVKQVPLCRTNVMPFCHLEEKGNKLLQNISSYRKNYRTLDAVIIAKIFNTKSYKTSTMQQ